MKLFSLKKVAILLTILVLISAAVQAFKDLNAKKNQASVQLNSQSEEPVNLVEKTSKQTAKQDLCLEIPGLVPTQIFSDFAFCQPSSWGEAKFEESGISKEAIIGNLYYLTFPQADFYFQIQLESSDFQKLGDSDVSPLISWQDLDFSKSVLELSDLFPSYSSPTLQKIVIEKKEVLKAYFEYISPLSNEEVKQIHYYLPDIKVNKKSFNLIVISEPGKEKSIENLLKTLIANNKSS